MPAHMTAWDRLLCWTIRRCYHLLGRRFSTKHQRVARLTFGSNKPQLGRIHPLPSVACIVQWADVDLLTVWMNREQGLIFASGAAKTLALQGSQYRAAGQAHLLAPHERTLEEVEPTT